MQMLLRLVRKNEKPIFVQNKQEFLSLWAVAHAWEKSSPDSADTDSVPASIQANIDILLLAFLRDEIVLRRSDGYRVLGHTLSQAMLGLDKDYERISGQLYRKAPFDKAFLDDLYVKRSNLLHWCEGEYRSPPECWNPLPTSANDKPLEEEDDDANNAAWIEQITERRRKIVACLEVAKHIWQENPKYSYEEVFNHQLLVRTGLRSVFSFGSFKTWARNIASEDAKRGGRRV